MSPFRVAIKYKFLFNKMYLIWGDDGFLFVCYILIGLHHWSHLLIKEFREKKTLVAPFSSKYSIKVPNHFIFLPKLSFSLHLIQNQSILVEEKWVMKICTCLKLKFVYRKKKNIETFDTVQSMNFLLFPFSCHFI